MIRALYVACAVICGCGGSSSDPATPHSTPHEKKVEPAQLAAPMGDHPWPMFRGAADHTGDWRTLKSPVGRVRWRAQLGERVDASPVIDAEGSIYVVTRSGQVSVLDGKTGNVLRWRRLTGGLWASPALVGEVLVVASSEGFVAGLDLRTLDEKWRVRTNSKSFSGIAVAGDRAYLCAGSELLAIAGGTGKVLARVDLGAPSFTVPALSSAKGLVVVANRRGQVLAFDAMLLKPIWTGETSAGAHNDGSPVIAGVRVLVGSNDNGLHAFDLETGAQQWVSKGKNWVVSTSAVADGMAYYGDDGGVLHAVGIAEGRERWRVQVGDDLASSPTIVGEVIVHGAHDGKVWFHKVADGTPAAEPIDGGAPMYASVALGRDGLVVIATHGGAVLAIE